MDIHPKQKLFLFHDLGLEGFNFFIVNNDERVINELLFDYKKCNTNLNNHKLKLCAMKFCIQTWEKMPNNKKEQLTNIVQNFFHLLKQFEKLKNTTDMNILISENNIEDIISSNCGIFQTHFYKNLFDPEEKSKIINHKNLNKKTIETIINEIFSTDVDENEHLIEKFKDEYDL